MVASVKLLERRFIYSLLSDIFTVKPDKEFLSKLDKAEVYDLLLDYFESRRDLEELKKYISESLTSKDELSSLQNIFDSTFVIPVASYYIPPVMSAFVNHRNLRTNNTYYTIAEELKSMYSFFNVSFEKPADHISVIFAFMSFLISIKDTKGEESDIEKEFFSRYVNTWAEKFFKEVLTRTDNIFYVYFSKFACEFLKKERRFFKR